MPQVAEVMMRGATFIPPFDLLHTAALATGTPNPEGGAAAGEDDSADDQADGGDKSLDDDDAEEDPSSQGATSSESESQVSSETRLRQT